MSTRIIQIVSDVKTKTRRNLQVFAANATYADLEGAEVTKTSKMAHVTKRLRVSSSLLLSLATLSGFSYGYIRDEEEVKRPVTVEDTIRMTKLGDPYYWKGGLSRGLVAQFSPDGKHFIVVLRKGNLERNTNEYSMLLWQCNGRSIVSDRPIVLLVMSSSSNRAGIHEVKWLADSETVEFLGEKSGEKTRLYAFNTRTHRLKVVAAGSNNILAYTTTPVGDQVAYIAEAERENLFDDSAIREGFRVSTQPFYKLLVGQRGVDPRGEKQLFFQSHGKRGRQLTPAGRIEYRDGRHDIHLSPDGQYVILLSHVSDFPEGWKKYSNSELQRALSSVRIPGQTSWVTRYEIIETATGKSHILLDVPQEGWDTEVAWSPSSRSVAISHSYLPLRGDDTDSESIRSKRYLVEVAVQDGKITVIGEQNNLKLLAWDANSDQLICESGRDGSKPSPGAKVAFRKSRDKWKQISDAVPETRAEIVLEEDMNTAPKIVAVDPQTHERRVLLDLNPDFQRLKFGKVEEITWRTTDNSEIKGGLYYPVDYVQGRRYPLLIQTHGWTPDKFWIDGPWTTASAAQPLAGKGIMVLQADHRTAPDDWWVQNMNTPREVDAEVSAYQSAIEHLDRTGLIDPNRVGIVGFSRTCLYVQHMLADSRFHFAAASITDGVDGGYLQYVLNVTYNPGYASELEGLNGGVPFGEGLKSWLVHSPGFNVDKVRTPVFISALNPVGLLWEWEWFAALSRLGRPVELVYIQDGEHLLQRPWDRMVSQQGTVDWFTFWLIGEEDPKPAKVEKYLRWRAMRRQ